jgi:hypothetical protein
MNRKAGQKARPFLLKSPENRGFSGLKAVISLGCGLASF